MLEHLDHSLKVQNAALKEACRLLYWYGGSKVSGYNFTPEYFLKEARSELRNVQQ